MPVAAAGPVIQATAIVDTTGTLSSENTPAAPSRTASTRKLFLHPPRCPHRPVNAWKTFKRGKSERQTKMIELELKTTATDNNNSIYYNSNNNE
jgi:hypothetical protein